MGRFYSATFSLFLLASAHVEAQLTYTIRDLGTLGGTNSAGNGINDKDQVTGSASLPDDTARNAYYTGINGAPPLQNLGTLGGARSSGQSINSNGVVVGVSEVDDIGTQHAFISGANGIGLSDLRTLGGLNSYAYGVNGAGQVAGYSLVTGNGANHAFLSSGNGGALRDLGTLPGGTSSFVNASSGGVNASGQVAGYSGTASGYSHAFLSEANGGILHDLGTLGGLTSFGVAVNDSGQVTGRSDVSGSGAVHAFRSGPNGGALFDLGTLGGGGSYGQAINNSGAVVGYSYLSGNGVRHAFLYTTTYGMMDLNSQLVDGSTWTLLEARGINGQGHITGVGMIAGAEHAFLLVPILPKLELNSITKLSNGHIFLAGAGGASQSYGVEMTADLAQPFTRVATLMATGNGTLEFEDSDAGNFATRFYRLVYP